MEALEQSKQWYVLRDFKKRNAKEPGYKLLTKLGVRNFTPLHWIITMRNGIRKREYVPVIPSLLFAYGTREVLDPIIERVDSLQYQFIRGAGSGTPMQVPERDMEDFIEAVDNDKDPIYISSDELTPDKIGRQVRIIGGNFHNRIANLYRMQGSKKKRIIFKVEGIIAAAVEVKADYFEFI